MVIKASHEPIIYDQLFEHVQELLNGSKRKFPKRQTAKEELPLRGLDCKQCGSNLPAVLQREIGANASTITVSMRVRKGSKQKLPTRNQ